MKYTFLIPLMLIGCILCACNNKEIEKGEFPEDQPPYEEGTPDRQYLEDVSLEFLNAFSANDQRDVSVGLNKFLRMCQTYEFPDNFYDEPSAVASRDLNDIVQAIYSSDFTTLSRSMVTYAYTMSRFKGLYQANTAADRWEFIESRDDVTFRYMAGTTVYNLMIKGEDGYWTESYNDGSATYSVDVPRTLKVILYLGQVSADKQLLSALLNIDGKDNDHLKIKGEIKYGNFVIHPEYNATNTKINEVVDVFVDNVTTYYRTEMLTLVQNVVGNNLCSIQAWGKVAQENAHIGTLVNNVSSTVLIKKKIQIKTYLTDVKGFVNNIGKWYDSDANANPKSAAEYAASTLNSAVKGEMFYTGNYNKVRATLGWEPYLYDQWDGYQEWGVRPTITFTSDGATFDFESYFGNARFMSVENRLNTLLNTYKQFWK